MNLREPAQSPQGATVDLQRSFDRLEVDLRKLRIDFERFFNGALSLPPEDFRQSLQGRLRILREAKGLSAADRFRLAGLEARFSSYSELFHRRLRDREEGRVSGPSPVAMERSRHNPQEGILVGDRIDPAATEALYLGLAKGGEAPRFDLYSFGQYLQRQADSIREKTQCQQVRFRLEESAGKIRLKAMPIKGDEEKVGE